MSGVGGPLTANQKKKLRQKRSKLGKRQALLSQSATLSSAVGDCSSSFSVCQTAACEQSLQGESADSTSTALDPQARPLNLSHLSPVVPGGGVTGPALSIATSGALGAGAQPNCLTAVTPNPADGDSNGESLPGLSTAEGRIPAGCRSNAPQPCGRTDMTAALLVMHTAANQLLDQQQQRVLQAGSPAGAVAVHGNYRNYYGYRGSAEEDPRLQAMERCWFMGKRCLDVGCNAGLVSLAVAAKFGTAAMLGLDIDGALVHQASVNLSRARAETASQLGEARKMGAADVVRSLSSAHRALKGAWFQQGDMGAEPSPVKPGSCDVALALSVTKWVHINAGDSGLLQFFAALHAALVPGGLLILEPQPWRSYKQAVRKQGVATGQRSTVLASLQLRPEGFVDHLEGQGTFRLVRQLLQPAAARGFVSRPMYLLECL